MTQNFSKGMEANFRSIFHKLMAMPESKTKLTGEKKSWIRGGRIFCQRYQKIILVVCFDLDEFVEYQSDLLLFSDILSWSFVRRQIVVVKKYVKKFVRKS